MKKQLVVLVALVTLASAKVMPCAGSKGPLPKLVTDDDCDLDSDERCGFIRGKSFKADITFTARKTCCQAVKINSCELVS